VHIDPAGRDLRVSAAENILGAALAAGLPLPHSCRAGRCASCKARILSGEVAYPDDRLPPGIVASEAARGEVLLCQAQPRSNLRIETRSATRTLNPACGVVVQRVEPLSLGGVRVTLQMLGATPLGVRPSKFVDVETAAGEHERVPVVAANGGIIDVEILELPPEHIVRARGPFDAPR
jgi:ferredoxin